MISGVISQRYREELRVHIRISQNMIVESLHDPKNHVRRQRRCYIRLDLALNLLQCQLEDISWTLACAECVCTLRQIQPEFLKKWHVSVIH